MKCQSGTTNFRAAPTASEKTSDIGDKGCCTSGPARRNRIGRAEASRSSTTPTQLYFRIKETAGAPRASLLVLLRFLRTLRAPRT